MAYVAVLDTCVLYPQSLCDTLLRMADSEFFELRWSRRILDELERNLAERVGDEGAARRRQAMTDAFDGAEVDPDAIDRLEPKMDNDPKDRHVLAAAVAAGAQAVVTANVKDFPDASADRYGIEIVHPDEFLLILIALNPGLAADIICAQAGALKRPPLTAGDVLDALSIAGVPEFTAAVRDELASRSPATQVPRHRPT